MKKTIGIISIILFILSAVLGTSDFVFAGGLLPRENQADVFIYILATTIPPVVGFTLAFFSKKRALKITGIIGNGAVMMLTIILPLVVNIFFPIQ
ncbi:hypothetical protein A3863_04800 [Priestia endophytica]|uniref:hypothetical protein n=1 Tax=Priestia endophytica TaxID=135735 RepID=UPI000DCA3F1F|nr:hypothetical protein [Priestia endophytica]RAS91801.1 hypothetical protein A3863_04800 [Priestia endophytica]